MAEALEQLVLGPIELVLDGIFSVFLRWTGSPGIAILFLSLAVNLMVSPLYRRADALQREARETALRLRPGVQLIKAAFTGDERFMILQTYYRQHHYRPWYALKSSLSLLLQIPFFLAAYRYLSSLDVLHGASFWPIADLGAPDGLLTIGGTVVHVLPILMTLINLFSGLLYARKMPLRDQLQLYGLSLVFLVVLYSSPSGLVLYWTINNAFSLGKNILQAVRRRRENASAAAETAFAPPNDGKASPGRHSAGITLTCCMLLTLLTGLLIPAAVLRSSPAEFIEVSEYASPLFYLWRTLLIAAGAFLIWLPLYLRLSPDRIRRRFPPVLVFCVITGFVNYLFFGRYGNMSSLLQYDTAVAEQVQLTDCLWNLALTAAIGLAVRWLWMRKRAVLRAFCFAECAAIAVLSAVHTADIARQLPELERLASQGSEEYAGIIPLDQRGRNVVVLMLDKAIGAFTPYLFEEMSSLREQFAGFTCYPNTLSYGGHTNVGAPALFGGYEYTPDRMDQRTDLLLADKHNEALKVLPAVFQGAGFTVTVCDPPLAGYQWIPDLSIYDDLPKVRSFLTEGRFTPNSAAQVANNRAVRVRNFFRYSLFRIAPVFLHAGLYDSGDYLHADGTDDGAAYSLFMRSYLALAHLSDMTAVSDTGQSTFLMMANHTTHDVIPLPASSYEPVFGTVRTQDETRSDRIAADGSVLLLETEDQQKHYQCTMAALLQIGAWLDDLRAQGVYDNTRIILAADHGWDLGFSDWQADSAGINTMNYNPLLLVKDFDCQEPFAFSDAFMTNADTPTIALAGLVEDPVNPFTGQAITDQAKAAEPQIVIESPWQFADNNGTAFMDEQVFALENRDVRIAENWRRVR